MKNGIKVEKMSDGSTEFESQAEDEGTFYLVVAEPEMPIRPWTITPGSNASQERKAERAADHLIRDFSEGLVVDGSIEKASIGLSTKSVQSYGNGGFGQ